MNGSTVHDAHRTRSKRGRSTQRLANLIQLHSTNTANGNVTTAPHTNPVTAVRNRIVRVGDANTHSWNTPYSNANEYYKTTDNRPSLRRPRPAPDPA